ncbi:MAG: hypothetical protein ACRC41_15785 [Sarcina sp.]
MLDIKKMKTFFEAQGLYYSEIDIKRILEIEGFLLFCYENGYTKEVNKYNTLPMNLHKIGREKFTELDYKLNKVRNIYFKLASKSYYKASLQYYDELDIQCRMFYIKDNTLIKNTDTCFDQEDRKKCTCFGFIIGRFQQLIMRNIHLI